MRSEAEIRARIQVLEPQLDAAWDKLEAAANWEVPPYLRDEDLIAALRANIDYMDELTYLTKALEAGIAELEWVLGGEDEEANKASKEQDKPRALPVLSYRDRRRLRVETNQPA